MTSKSRLSDIKYLMSGSLQCFNVMFWIPFGFSTVSITGILVTYGSYVVSNYVGGSKTVKATYCVHCLQLTGSDSCTRAEKRKVTTGDWTKVSYFYESYQEVNSKWPFWQINTLAWPLNSSSWSSPPPPKPLSIPACTCIREEFRSDIGSKLIHRGRVSQAI